MNKISAIGNAIFAGLNFGIYFYHTHWWFNLVVGVLNAGVGICAFIAWRREIV